MLDGQAIAAPTRWPIAYVIAARPTAIDTAPATRPAIPAVNIGPGCTDAAATLTTWPWKRFHRWHPTPQRAANSTSTTPNPHGPRPNGTESTQPQRYTPRPPATTEHSLAKAGHPTLFTYVIATGRTSTLRAERLTPYFASNSQDHSLPRAGGCSLAVTSRVTARAMPAAKSSTSGAVS